MQIYLLENTINGKYYVGKTVSKNLNSYLSVKRWAAKFGKQQCMPIVRAIAKYGWDAFKVHVLATAENAKQLAELERLWIVSLNARDPQVGYNVSAGGEASRLGISMSDETKVKIGTANRGRKPKGYTRTEEHRKQLSERMQGNDKGIKITPEQARAWKAAESPEQKAKRGAAIKAAWARRKLLKRENFAQAR